MYIHEQILPETVEQADEVVSEILPDAQHALQVYHQREKPFLIAASDVMY